MRRAERIYDAVTSIRSEYIEQAAEYKFRKKNAVLRIGSLAAAACLAVCAGVFGARYFLQTGNPGPSTPEEAYAAVFASVETEGAALPVSSEAAETEQELPAEAGAGDFPAAETHGSATSSNKASTVGAEEDVLADESDSDAGGLSDSEAVEVKPQSLPGYGVSFRLPRGWVYEIGGFGEPVVRIMPDKPGLEGDITLYHTDRFGVCGTGLEQREVLFNGRPAWQGFYDGNTVWSFIVLKDPEDCVIINSAGDWYAEYKEEIDSILSTVEFVYYGEGPALDVNDNIPGDVSPAFVLDGVAEWAKHRLGSAQVQRYDMDTRFRTNRTKELILDHEALLFDDGTVFGYCTYSVPQWNVTTNEGDVAYGDGVDLVASLIRAEAGRLQKECYVDSGMNRAFFLISDKDKMDEYIGFYMNTLSGARPTSVTATTKTVYAIYTENGALFADCLNADLMTRSAVRHLPVYKLDTMEDLESFRTRFQSILTQYPGLENHPTFDEGTTAYDEEFFSRNTVVLAYVTAASGSYRFGIRNVTADGALCRLDIVQTNHPEVCTSDMGAWFVLAEIPDSEIAGCTQFDARLVE